MKAAEIRRRFIDYFVRNGHTHVTSSSLVPANDPTLLFTNAGMVQFKGTFLGQEPRPYKRATTAQKCVRAGGKHNDLEQVGETARHHTFFEMLGNFSFGDYFKREAIRYGWEFCTSELGLDPDRLWATVHHTDDEAFELWQEEAGLPRARILRFGDKDNFWQMAETGPCGPCAEILYDQRPKSAKQELTADEFEALSESGDFLELWNLVFMQFNRDEEGVLDPLPKPSIDTGAGLERIAAALQGANSNFHTDLFMPLIRRAEEVVQLSYAAEEPGGVSFRVLADHARAVAFLIADGVFPTNEGRGYVLRRILRRAGRHAWLLGRREPTLYQVCDEVVAQMGEDYPELLHRREHILRTARGEEERFMATIDGGMERFEAIAPKDGHGVVPGEEAFKLYDTYGFPLDLTELMARERGYEVDVAGFERALELQRRRSREKREEQRRRGDLEGLSSDIPTAGWSRYSDDSQEWVGYEQLSVDTDVLAAVGQDGRIVLELRWNPFYAESGGQVSDRGHVEGDGWRMEVEGVARLDDRTLIAGPIEGEFKPGLVRAVVDDSRRDTQRNHTATHLLHAALRSVLGEHVSQAGSLVAPERLRFDFTHSGPLSDAELEEVERLVNEQIWTDKPVAKQYLAYKDAISRGAMALFGEKYGDIVRVVEVPGFSLELCGGCHVRTTGEIGLFQIASETGSAAGVRRIEAVSGPYAYEQFKDHERLLDELGRKLRVPPEGLLQRIEVLLEEQRALREQMHKHVERAAADDVGRLVDGAVEINGAKVATGTIETADSETLRTFGDRLRERLGTGVAVVAAKLGERHSLLAVVTDDLIGRGVRADEVVREVAKLAGGKGGGRPHMAQASTGDPGRVVEALKKVPEIVRPLLERAGK
ncbi:MAG: alanine--tRNA ligase [Gemmatimonadota bacterium]|nr:MAG: alanine--tRNA ligase [Gemmatimonadota bacterium]